MRQFVLGLTLIVISLEATVARALPAKEAPASALDQPNTAPFGWLDEPIPDAIVSGSGVLVRGWVLDREDAVLRVELSVDGQIVSTSPSRHDRPDVCANPVAAGIAYCTNRRPGVAFRWNTLFIGNGTHTVQIKAIDSQGSISTGMSATVVVANDTPQGTSYYVAQTENASDQNDGKTIDTPFRTIQKCASIVVAGDVCLVRAGVYRETVTPARSGSSTKKITFMPYNGEAVTVSGADIVSGWSVYKGSIYQSRNVDWDLGQGRNQLFLDSEAMTEARWPNTGTDLSNPTWATAGDGGVVSDSVRFLIDSNLTQPDGFWNGAIVVNLGAYGFMSDRGTVINYRRGRADFDFAVSGWGNAAPGSPYFLVGKLEALDTNREWFKDSSGAYLWAPQGDDPNGHIVEMKRRFFAFDLSSRSHIVVQGFRIFAAGINMDLNSNNILIDGIHAKYTAHFYGGNWDALPDDTGIRLFGSLNTIQNCEIAFSAGTGVRLIGDHHKVSDCLIHDVDYSASGAAAIHANNRTDQVDGAGFHQITYNTIYNAGRDGIAHVLVPGLTITHNHIFNIGLQTNDNGITYTWATDGGGTEIAYNMLHDNKAICYHIGFGPGIYLDDNSREFSIHHNVIWNTSGCIYDSPGIFLHLDGAINNQIYNNTIWNTAGPGVQNQGLLNVNTYNNLSNKQLQGIDLRNNLTTSDPKFVNPDNWDFQLQSGSPAVDFGLVIPGVTFDYVGSAPDAGAYEQGLPLWSVGTTVFPLF